MPKTATTDGGGAAHDPRGKLADFAEDLGKLLGSTERKATQWLSQRENVAKQLSAIRDKASSLLQQLGSVAGESPLGEAEENEERLTGFALGGGKPAAGSTSSYSLSLRVTAVAFT